MPRTPRLRGWAAWGLVLYGVFAAIVVFTPVSYAGVVKGIAAAIATVPGLGFFGSGWIEFVANVLLFVPLGFLLSVLVDRPWLGAVLGIVISAGVELIQVLIPYRQATVRDVVSNTIGAAIGALIAWLIVLRRRRRR